MLLIAGISCPSHEMCVVKQGKTKDPKFPACCHPSGGHLGGRAPRAPAQLCTSGGFATRVFHAWGVCLWAEVAAGSSTAGEMNPHRFVLGFSVSIPVFPLLLCLYLLFAVLIVLLCCASPLLTTQCFSLSCLFQDCHVNMHFFKVVFSLVFYTQHPLCQHLEFIEFNFILTLF